MNTNETTSLISLTEEITDYIKRIDPTSKKTYLKWITEQYQSGKLSHDKLYSDEFVFDLIFFKEKISTSFKTPKDSRNIKNLSFEAFESIVSDFKNRIIVLPTENTPKQKNAKLTTKSKMIDFIVNFVFNHEDVQEINKIINYIVKLDKTNQKDDDDNLVTVNIKKEKLKKSSFLFEDVEFCFIEVSFFGGPLFYLVPKIIHDFGAIRSYDREGEPMKKKEDYFQWVKECLEVNFEDEDIKLFDLCEKYSKSMDIGVEIIDSVGNILNEIVRDSKNKKINKDFMLRYFSHCMQNKEIKSSGINF